jgi:hypothetical protein
MAQRYGQLPSHVLDHGTTWDMAVMLAAYDEQQRQQRLQSMGVKQGQKQPNAKYSQDELAAMIQRVRGKQ